jgi:alpha-beta hydrolase superfamily lysophospholipase
MKALKSLLVGAAACAAVAAAPAVVSGRDMVTTGDAKMNLKTVTLHGDRVAYRDEGAGEVLLLVHGMGGSSDTWGGVIPLLARKYRVIAPDLLGHGQSDKPRGD